MDPRYASFIWACFGIAAIAVLWNVFAPRLERNQIKQKLSQQRDDGDASPLTMQATGSDDSKADGFDSGGGDGGGGGD